MWSDYFEMAETVSLREYVDARIAEVTATNEAIHAGTQAGLRTLSAEVHSLNERTAALPKMWQLIVTIVGATAAAISIVLAVLAFGGDRFDAGVSLSATSIEQATTANNLAAEAARKLGELDQKMDANWARWNEQRQVMDAQWRRVDQILPALEALANQAKQQSQQRPDIQQ
jgi:hypothetical protein